MLGHNVYPGQGERQKEVSEESIQFQDGQTAVGYRTRGDTFILGVTSQQKYAQGLHDGGEGAAWIKTASGNRYGITRGVIVDYHANTPDATPTINEWPVEGTEVTIGKPLVIPGVLETSDVNSVLLRAAVEAPGRPGNQQSTGVDPFPGLSQYVEQVYIANPHLR